MKTILIIDAPYMHSLTKRYGKYDVIKLTRRLESDLDCSFNELQYFDTPLPASSVKKNGFYKWLGNRPGSPVVTVNKYEPSKYTLFCPRCDALIGKYARTAMTMGIATFLISSATAEAFDRYVICSGVAGLGEPIEHIRTVAHRDVTVCGFRGETSISALGGSEIFWLDDIWGGIRRRKKHPHSGVA